MPIGRTVAFFEIFKLCFLSTKNRICLRPNIELKPNNLCGLFCKCTFSDLFLNPLGEVFQAILVVARTQAVHHRGSLCLSYLQYHGTVLHVSFFRTHIYQQVDGQRLLLADGSSKVCCDDLKMRFPFLAKGKKSTIKAEAKSRIHLDGVAGK